MKLGITSQGEFDKLRENMQNEIRLNLLLFIFLPNKV